MTARRLVAGLLSAVAVPVAALAALGDATPAMTGVPPAALQASGEGAAPRTPGSEDLPPVRRRLPDAQPVVARGTGVLAVVRGGTRIAGSGPLHRYRVEVEGGLPVEPGAFAEAVDATLRDARSWGADGRVSFQRVADGPVAFRVVLASPATTDRLCAPLRTLSSYSCANAGAAVINFRRWQRGAAAYGPDLAGYRHYVVNHEVGHVLGNAHEDCPGAGRDAPVMVQQTISVGGCRPNPWPYP